MFLQAILQEKANFLPNFHYLGICIWYLGIWGLLFGFGICVWVFGFFGIWANSKPNQTIMKNHRMNWMQCSGCIPP